MEEEEECDECGLKTSGKLLVDKIFEGATGGFFLCLKATIFVVLSGFKYLKNIKWLFNGTKLEYFYRVCSE